MYSCVNQQSSLIIITNNIKPFFSTADCSKNVCWRSRQFGTCAEVSARHCPDISAPVWWCRNVLGPKCPGSEVSWHWWNFQWQLPFIQEHICDGTLTICVRSLILRNWNYGYEYAGSKMTKHQYQRTHQTCCAICLINEPSRSVESDPFFRAGLMQCNQSSAVAAMTTFLQQNVYFCTEGKNYRKTADRRRPSANFYPLPSDDSRH